MNDPSNFPSLRIPQDLRLVAVALVFASLAAAGCAPSLSTFQPAHVAPKHHVQAEIGMDVSVPTGTISAAIEAGETLGTVAADKKRELTDAEIDQIYKASSALTLNPPSATPHVGLAFTVVDNFEVGLRYSTNSLRVGGRYQILRKEKHKVDLTAGVGFGYYVLALPIGDTLKVVKLEDFTRYQVDVPLVIGTHGSWYRVWAGPRFVYTHFGTELKLDIPEIPGVTAGKTELASFGGNGFYVGGQGGIAVGYKYVFLGFELTMVQLFMDGKLDVLQKTAATYNLDSFIVYPAIGLMGEF